MTGVPGRRVASQHAAPTCQTRRRPPTQDIATAFRRAARVVDPGRLVKDGVVEG